MQAVSRTPHILLQTVLLLPQRDVRIQFEKPISLEEISGHGIVAEMPEGKVLCGNRKLMDKFGVTIGELKKPLTVLKYLWQ